jgi:hypothetical protein
MENKAICQSPWCKAPFIYTEKDMIDGKRPKTCKKCQSFDTELSDGVSWLDKKYAGANPFKGDSIEISHEIKYNNK